MRETKRQRRGVGAARWLWLAIPLSICGCSAPGNSTGREAGATSSGGVTGASATSMSSEELQATLFGYADTYIALVSQAADNLLFGNEQQASVRMQAIRAKLDGAEAVVEIVTGPNPAVALLDLAVMVTLQRQVWIDFWQPAVFKEAAFNFMDSLERLETEIWLITERAFTKQQADELRELAAQIREQYIHQVFVTSLRASQITSNLGDPSSKVRPSPGLVGLFGLDPALAEVTQTRILAERIFYFGQKMPTLLGWRVDLQLASALVVPETVQALANVDEVVKNTTRFAEVAEALPKTIADERTALLRSAEEVIANEVGRIAVTLSNERTALFAGITSEREALLKALDEGQGDAKSVLAELRVTIDAAKELSKTVGSVMDQVTAITKPSEPAPGAPPAEPGRPFDIRDYQGTVESTTVTIKELNATLAEARELIDSPSWAAREGTVRSLMGEVERSARSLIVFASLGLGGAIFIALTAATLVRRLIGAPRGT